MRFIIILLFICQSALSPAQTIKRWKITDVVNYIEKNDSIVILNFWATWCKPCIEELPYFQKVAAKYTGKKVKLLLVSLDFGTDYPSKIAAFAKKNNYDAQIVWLDETDADYFCPKIDRSWGGAIPSTLIYDHQTGFRFFREGQVKEERLTELLDQAIHKRKDL